jgi:Fic-DOC domain mobile mystery protein B
VSDIFEQPDDAATPLREEERRALKLAHIANREQLNAAEQENIARGQEWALGRRRDWLTERNIRSLRRHMFGDVWRWAGRLRTHEVNIGLDHWQIPAELRVLVDNAKTWIETEAYPPDKIAVCFHHRLTQIHSFANGNGRHARLIADLLVMHNREFLCYIWWV